MTKTQKTASNAKLSLRRETLRELTSTDLAKVVGGQASHTSTSPNPSGG